MSTTKSKISDVFFFVNGSPRLMLASVLAADQYRERPKHLILLDQYGYNYDDFLPYVRELFDSVGKIKVNTRKHSHLDQFLNCYFNSYPAVTTLLKENSTLVMFGIRSPLQKYLLRYFKSHGGEVDLYAESLAVARYFSPRVERNMVVGILRSLFSRAFDYPHDYDRFHVYFKEIHSSSLHYDKLREMPDIYGGPQFKKLAERVWRETSELSSSLSQYDCWFFGQPLSNFDDLISKQKEVSMLKQILGDEKVLALPHPNEILGRDDKYSFLPNVEVLNCKVPNDLVLAMLQPSKTITYGSTIGLTYALHNPLSCNYFYPVYASQVKELRNYKQYLENIEISDELVLQDKQY